MKFEEENKKKKRGWRWTLWMMKFYIEIISVSHLCFSGCIHLFLLLYSRHFWFFWGFLRFTPPRQFSHEASICHSIMFAPMFPQLRAPLHNMNSLNLYILVQLLNWEHPISSVWILYLPGSSSCNQESRFIWNNHDQSPEGSLLEWIVSGKVTSRSRKDIIFFMFLTQVQIWAEQSSSWDDEN